MTHNNPLEPNQAPHPDFDGKPVFLLYDILDEYDLTSHPEIDDILKFILGGFNYVFDSKPGDNSTDGNADTPLTPVAEQNSTSTNDLAIIKWLSEQARQHESISGLLSRAEDPNFNRALGKDSCVRISDFLMTLCEEHPDNIFFELENQHYNKPPSQQSQDDTLDMRVMSAIVEVAEYCIHNQPDDTCAIESAVAEGNERWIQYKSVAMVFGSSAAYSLFAQELFNDTGFIEYFEQDGRWKTSGPGLLEMLYIDGNT